MHLYGIGDPHLALGVPDKPMDIFQGWENYMELFQKNWCASVQPEDTVVLAGDISWGMTLPQAKADFTFIDKLPGQKIILKGNHDYWWNSMRKMEQFFVDNGFSTLHLLHNNHYAFGEYGICGTRGWVNMNGESADAKVLAREVQRLEVSIQSALTAGLQPIVFLHYPPIYGNSYNYDILEVLHKYQIADCYYGHIHGKSHQYAFQGHYEKTRLHMISGDYLQFNPKIIL